MALKTDSSGRKYNDYTNGKTFYQFETMTKSKVMMHIISHLIIIFCWFKVIQGWDDIALYNGDTFSLVMGWLIVGILSAVPILYWGMSYRKYKQLQKGISS